MKTQSKIVRFWRYTGYSEKKWKWALSEKTWSKIKRFRRKCRVNCATLTGAFTYCRCVDLCLGLSTCFSPTFCTVFGENEVLAKIPLCRGILNLIYNFFKNSGPRSYLLLNDIKKMWKINYNFSCMYCTHTVPLSWVESIWSFQEVRCGAGGPGGGCKDYLRRVLRSRQVSSCM